MHKLLLVAFLLIACSSNTTAAQIDFSELVANPAKYDGKVVRTAGWYVDAFETSALGRSTEQRGNATYLTEPSIWINRAVVLSETECFTTETIPPARFCRVEVEGEFEYGESYGHLSAYKYQITPAK